MGPSGHDPRRIESLKEIQFGQPHDFELDEVAEDVGSPMPPARVRTRGIIPAPLISDTRPFSGSD